MRIKLDDLEFFSDRLAMVSQYRFKSDDGRIYQITVEALK